MCTPPAADSWPAAAATRTGEKSPRSQDCREGIASHSKPRGSELLSLLSVLPFLPLSVSFFFFFFFFFRTRTTLTFRLEDNGAVARPRQAAENGEAHFFNENHRAAAFSNTHNFHGPSGTYTSTHLSCMHQRRSVNSNFCPPLFVCSPVNTSCLAEFQL